MLSVRPPTPAPRREIWNDASELTLPSEEDEHEFYDSDSGYGSGESEYSESVQIREFVEMHPSRSSPSSLSRGTTARSRRAHQRMATSLVNVIENAMGWWHRLTRYRFVRRCPPAV